MPIALQKDAWIQTMVPPRRSKLTKTFCLLIEFGVYLVTQILKCTF